MDATSESASSKRTLPRLVPIEAAPVAGWLLGALLQTGAAHIDDEMAKEVVALIASGIGIAGRGVAAGCAVILVSNAALPRRSGEHRS